MVAHAPQPSIPVALFLPNGAVQEVRLPAVPRVGDRIDYGLDDKNRAVGSGVVTAVEWDITNLERPTVGVVVNPRQ